jgi:hypothetical protein
MMQDGETIPGEGGGKQRSTWFRSWTRLDAA